MVQLTFEHAANLWFLFAIPLIVIGHFLFLRYSQKRALRFANFRALKRITGERLITRNYGLLWLRAFIVLFAVLAVSGATLWYEGRSSNNDFVIAVDTSASMTAQDVPPTRLEAAKGDAQLFIDALPGNSRVGVVSFSGVAFIVTAPVPDKGAAKEAVASLEPMEAGGTDIPGAIITSTNLLLDNEKGRSIILITDGSNTIESFLDKSLQRSIAYAQEHHVRVHTIGVGTDTGPIGYLPTYYNVSSVYNEQNLVGIANATKGTYARADNATDLLAAFQRITDDTSVQLIRKDLRAHFMVAALALLFIEWVLVNTRYRRIP